MFVHAEVPVDAAYEAAKEGLRSIAADGWLTGVSGDVYDSSQAGFTGMTRVGPSDGARWVSKLVRVYVRDVVVHDGRAVLTLRWEATGPGGGLFPALDADITLSPAEGGPGCLLTLDGVYRPPFGALGAGLDRIALSRVAGPTARSLLRRIADSIGSSAGSAAEKDTKDGADADGVRPREQDAYLGEPSAPW
ncbi:MAG TPA: hypothetical protein VF843_04155 [Streptosporangiaceae bacterium]